MAKTVMISNEIYEELKTLKEKEKISFSELFEELLKSAKTVKIKDLLNFVGALKNDKEYDVILPRLGIEWKKWSKRYA